MNHTWLLVAGANCKGISSKKTLCFLISHKWPFGFSSHLLKLSEIMLVLCFTANHCFSHVYVSRLCILSSTYGLYQKVNVSYCISKYTEQMHLSTELRYSLSFGGAYSSCYNLGFTDPVLLIHRVYAVYYLKIDIRRTSYSAKTPSLGLQRIRMNSILQSGGKLCCKIKLCDQSHYEAKNVFFNRYGLTPAHLEQIYTTLLNTYNNH